ncbi:bifunctional 2-polyprenyl-6-hydroxyphenol methylase/3-demethylubiquinol 3-O-methyltransferase UbiG [Utexia brackfieldae]|uniref:bifunctional 2-polyprenyl-6-hydroxyphenol methylase/3-demethylubiquinol 3-O-methyltransferase UbiG n=1 Tax=Utexia brackfieldae TaxID=3074108 RepID=UPI00370D069C
MLNNPKPLNVDQSEIDKFSAMASEWWDPNGKFKPLHTINPLRVEYILSQTGDLMGKSVLDVGCGGGILTESLAKLGATTTAIDMAELSLNIAKTHAQAQHLTIDYRLESIEQHLAQTSQRYDVITCMEMLEHVPDPHSIIDSCAKLLKPQGKLFLSTINRNHKSRLMLIIGAEYIARIVPKGTHDFNKFIRPSELMGWIEQAGLATQAFIGMEYHLLGNKFTLGRNIDVNYIALATKK